MRSTQQTRFGALTLVLAFMMGCGAGPAEPSAGIKVETPAAPAAPTTPVSSTGTLRVLTPGLGATAANGGMVRLRPCTATTCPWSLGAIYPEYALSKSGTTELTVPAGVYAVDYFVPDGYLFSGPETGETMGVTVQASRVTTVSFAVMLAIAP